MSRNLDFFGVNQIQLEMAITKVKEWIVRKWTNTLKAVRGERLLSDTYMNADDDSSSLEYNLDQKVDLLMRALFDDYFVSAAVSYFLEHFRLRESSTHARLSQ